MKTRDELTLRDCGWEGDGWYVIEYADGTRLSDACVEGPATDMLGLADAIERRRDFSEWRCAVTFDGDRVQFYSPRNTTGGYGEVPFAVADALAAEIRAKLGGAR